MVRSMSLGRDERRPICQGFLMFQFRKSSVVECKVLGEVNNVDNNGNLFDGGSGFLLHIKQLLYNPSVVPMHVWEVLHIIKRCLRLGNGTILL